VSYDAADRLLSDGLNTYTYDAEGDLIAKAPRANPAAQTTYDWNIDHQLLAIHYPGGTSSTFAYDALGRRVQATGSGVTTRYTWDIKDNVHSEYDGSNQLVASYVHSLIADKPLEVTEGGASYYYVADGAGNVRALTDQSGAVVDRYRYDSFGNQVASGTVHNPLTYGAREFDAASGLYYNRARYYDPSTGRFISEDPLSRPSPYVYASNNPISLHDPSGKINEYSLIIKIDYTAAGPIIVQEQVTLTYTVGVAAPLVIGEADVTAEALLLQIILYGPVIFRLIALVVAFGYIAKVHCDFVNSVPAAPRPTTTCPVTPPPPAPPANCGPGDFPDVGGDGTKPVVGPGK
jgi:RHS repeat-associated protein